MRFEGVLCRFGFFAGEGASSNIVVLRRDIAQVIRWKPPYCPHRHLHIDQLNVEMGAPWKRRCRGRHGQLPCRAAIDLVKRLAGHGLDGLLCGAALLALKRSFGGTKCVMPALPFYSWVCEW